jgi:TM2 domain-containing membrane protein YozV
MSDKSNLLLMTYRKYFPDESLMMVREKFEVMDESQTSMLYALSLKDPIMALILSIVVGCLGIDRFYIGDTGLGIAKLLTCGGLGIWWLIDLFLIMKATKEKNFEKFTTIM